MLYFTIKNILQQDSIGHSLFQTDPQASALHNRIPVQYYIHNHLEKLPVLWSLPKYIPMMDRQSQYSRYGIYRFAIPLRQYYFLEYRHINNC